MFQKRIEGKRGRIPRVHFPCEVAKLIADELGICRGLQIFVRLVGATPAPVKAQHASWKRLDAELGSKIRVTSAGGRVQLSLLHCGAGGLFSCFILVQKLLLFFFQVEKKK